MDIEGKGKLKMDQRLRYTRKTHPLHDVYDVVYVHARIRRQFCHLERFRDLWPIQYVANTKACTTFTAPPRPSSSLSSSSSSSSGVVGNTTLQGNTLIDHPGHGDPSIQGEFSSKGVVGMEVWLTGTKPSV